MKPKILVGTRGSDLALAQTGHVVDALSELNPGVEFEVVVVKTTGDKDQRQNIETLGVGVFVRELEAALLDGRVDLAVHSLKDMPSTLPSEFKLAAVPPREDPRDAIISRSGDSLEDLPAGSRVATGSARRKALIKSIRPDLEVESLRGNVPTRLAKLDEDGGPDAVILATAGLNRLGISEKISAHLPSMEFVAAVGQGALTIEVRADDDATFEIANKLDDAETHAAVSAERAFLDVVGGGCSAPVSAHARITDGRIEISGFASTHGGSKAIRERISGNASDAIELGKKLGESYVKQGARELVAEKVG